MRHAVDNFSGKIFTLDGLFKVNRYGARIGEFLPVGQVLLTKTGVALKAVFPSRRAVAKAVYPAPRNK